MKLMCIGTAGTERSIVRVDDEGYIDVSDAVRDDDEAFFGSGDPPQLRNIVARRTSRWA
jgi:2,4-diketo-3-deoxy-L-fuconate hydrolase